MFGMVASPFLLAAVLEKQILDFSTNDFVKKALLNNKYVDNICYATNNIDNLLTFYKESTKLMKEGGFDLRQWASNNSGLMKIVNEDELADNESNIKVLGMLWSVKDDLLKFKPDLKWDGKFTKRSVLAATNGLFDPLCLLGPIEIQNRLFLQKLWNLEYKWDDSFQNDIELTDSWS